MICYILHPRYAELAKSVTSELFFDYEGKRVFNGSQLAQLLCYIQQTSGYLLFFIQLWMKMLPSAKRKRKSVVSNATHFGGYIELYFLQNITYLLIHNTRLLMLFVPRWGTLCKIFATILQRWVQNSLLPIIIRTTLPILSLSILPNPTSNSYHLRYASEINHRYCLFVLSIS